MSLLLVSVISSLGIILSKLLFKKWFNHLALYCLIFGGAVFFYELKLLPYIDITPFAWYVMVSSFISFLFGILTIISARNVYRENPTLIEKSDISLKIFSDDGRTLKYFLIVFSLISLYAAIEYWKILINQFGSIPAVLLNAKVIYQLNVSGQSKGATPYIFLTGYVAVFFAGIYTAYKKRFTLLSFIPLISIILREIAQAGRTGMLLSLMEFAFSFLLFRHLLNSDLSKRYKFSKKSALFGPVIMIILFIFAASLVRVSRGSETSEDISGASSELKQTKENFILSPSVYLYLSSDIGILSKYLDSKGENTGFGQNTFMTFYIFLSKFDIIKKPSEFQKGYHIPMWTNTGTYLRELHADFGISGIFLGPFLIGLLSTWLWFKFYEKKSLIVFTFLVYLFIIIGLSFFVMVSRTLYWSFGLALNLACIPALEKIATITRIKK